METNEYIEGAEELLAEFSCSLPDQVNALAYGAPYKTPFKIFSFREVLLHRVTDISSNAIALAKDNEVISAIILGRAILETAASLHLLSTKSQRFLDGKISIEQLDDYLMRSMFGSKEERTKYNVFSIQNAINDVAKKHPNFGLLYERTCEIVHPSWPGVQGGYAKLKQEEHTLHLGKKLTCLTEKEVWQPIAIGMSLFKERYNEDLPILQAVKEKLNG